MGIDLAVTLGPVRAAMLEVAAKARGHHVYNMEDIPCKAGCSHCCRTKVDITIAEAMVIMRSLKKSGKWDAVRMRALRQLPVVKSVNQIPWFMMRIPCPLLENDRCVTYDLRPVRCSTHFVTSDPRLCGPTDIVSGEYRPVFLEDLRIWFDKQLLNHVNTYGILNLKMVTSAALILAERASLQTGVDFSRMISLIYGEFK